MGNRNPNTSEELLKLIASAFTSQGYKIYEVGGSVRDRLLNRVPHDFDMTTDARPVETERILRIMGIGPVFTVGKEYGTIGLVCAGMNVEITTFRGEVHPAGRKKPAVVFGDSLYGDLARRDFTIGAMARDPISGEVIDPFDGASDLRSKKIRLVGGTGRFSEDPLRMLRAIRLGAELGFSLEVEMPDPHLLSMVSPERIRDELQKMLLCDNPERSIDLLRTYGLMPFVIPEMEALYGLEQGEHHIKDAYGHTLDVVEGVASFDSPDKIVLIFAALFHDIGKPETKSIENGRVHFYGHAKAGSDIARLILNRLRFDGDTTDRVCNLIEWHMYLVEIPQLTKRAAMRFVRKVGERDVQMLIDLAKADTGASRVPRVEELDEIEAIVAEALKDKPTEIISPLTGQEIMHRFDLQPSVRVGEVKEYLIGLVIDGVIARDDKESAFAAAAEFIAQGARSDGGTRL